MKHCPACGAAIKEGAKFCRYCGEKLIQKVQPKPDAPAPSGPWEGGARWAPGKTRAPQPSPPPAAEKPRGTGKAAAPAVCPHCGMPLPDDANFCAACGGLVQGVAWETVSPRKRGSAWAWGIGIAAAVCVVALGALAYYFLTVGGPWLPGGEAARQEEQLEASDGAALPAAGESGPNEETPQAEADPGSQQAAQSPASSSDQGAATGGNAGNGETQQPADQTEAAPAPRTKAEEIDFAQVENLVAAQAPNATWAYSILDVTNGLGYGSMWAKQPLSASAMVIVPILYTLAVETTDGQLELDTLVPITQNLGGRTQLAQQVGERLRVEELARYMLQFSDNIATNTLLEYLGLDTVEDICAAGGYESVRLANYIMATEDNTENDNYVSCADLCGMLLAIYTHADSAINGAFLEQYMHLQDDTASLGLLAQAPAAVDTMNLNGQKTGKYNEVALVRDGERVYAMAFLSHGDDLEALQNAAKDVGQYCIDILELGE